MKNQDPENKAEDILSDDQQIEQFKNEVSQKNPEDNYELNLAKTVYRFFYNTKNTIEEDQKVILGHRIFLTIQAYRRNKIILRISTAAVLLLIVGLTTFFQFNVESEVRSFANNQKNEPNDTSTCLILFNEHKIEISSNESNIEYALNGQTIDIDADKNVIQDIDRTVTVYNTVIVPYGKRSKITLSDNSKVWLNSGSKLIYPAKFDNGTREVYLEGEAIFEVTHDQMHPFNVVTNDMEIRVLGTVFNVSAYVDDITSSTTLKSGSVELKYKGNSIFVKAKEIMLPGMRAVYYPKTKTVEQTSVNTINYFSWRDGFFVFEKQSLGGILKKISRYYNVNIILNDKKLENETFSGNLDLKNSAMQVIEAIAEIMSAKVENTNGHILITKTY